MNKEIFLDNNATTKVDERVLNAMLPYLKESYGNPSSTYSFGTNVKDKINEVRNNVAKLINADSSEIIFTSCASESNVTAIMNAIRNNKQKKHIITTKVEHASILETMKYLEDNGYDVTYLNVDDKGRLNINELRDAIREDTCLIAVMMANNELGNVYPIEEIGKIAKEHNILFHCDAVQAIGKVDIDVNRMNIDTLSLAGHKIHAPKGIGVLYVRKGVPFIPLIFGHQEGNRRGGTENVAYIIGLGEAVKIILEDNHQSCIKMKELRDYMEKEIKERVKEIYIYGDIDSRTPNTSNMAIKGIKGEELMLLLESFGVYVSTGSACNAQIALPSHVLVACHADLDNYSPIRISLSKDTTKEEIDTFIKRLENIVNMIRKR
ncbi:MAG TPA: cysteine desulfurase NifS [Firmicutes bacterium]|nr:cysteine desulfurase NifS [Bacillota bacterium]